MPLQILQTYLTAIRVFKTPTIIVCLLFCDIALGQDLAVQQDLQQGWVIPRDDAAVNRSERVLLFLPRAPLLVELTLSIDDQPFRALSEEHVAALMKSADTNQDGQLSWMEALNARQLGRGINEAATPELLAIRKQQYDPDGDDIISKAEARRIWAQLSGGPALVVQGQAFLGPRADGSQLFSILDTDGDNEISEAEMQAAPMRLRSRDADDNEVVSLAELATEQSYAESLNVGGRMMAADTLLLPIVEGSDWKSLHNSLVEKYGQDRQLRAVRFDAMLDADQDGQINVEELRGLLAIKPHLAIDVALGTRRELRDTVKIVAMSDDVKSLARIDRDPRGAVKIDIPGVLLHVMAPNPKPNAGNYAGQVELYMASGDKNKNGYLEKNEIANFVLLVSQFDTWDANSDGKVYPAEIAKALEEAEIPQWQRITVGALSEGSDLLSVLDRNADQQLGVRELQEATSQLQIADRDGDGVFSAADSPVQIRLAIARGNETYQYLTKGTLRALKVRNQPGEAVGPDWFRNMDTNGDGSLTRREFLGEAAQFEELDANRDGLIEADEF